MLKLRGLSTKKFALFYFLIILLFSVVTLIGITLFGYHAYNEHEAHIQQFEQEVISRNIGDLVTFYRDIATAVSRQPEVKDIIDFSDEDAAVAWAHRIRQLLPDSIGVALINASGEVLGEPLQLKLGPKCTDDLKSMLANREVGDPPVHQEIASLEHFDITYPVISNGKNIGLVFLSFRLDVVQQRINHLADDNIFIEINARDGASIARTGSATDREKSVAAASRITIPNTDWQLGYITHDSSGEKAFLSTVAIGSIIFFIALILTFYLSLRLMRIFTLHLSGIREQLSDVTNNDKETASHCDRDSKNSEKIIEDVWGLMNDIKHRQRSLQEQSVTDELTSLSNRRAFNCQLDNQVKLAGRGIRSDLVLIDIDHFKAINDGYGHAIGDAVLIALANAMRKRCRTTDIIARLGGDEFAVILTGHNTIDFPAWYEAVNMFFRSELARIKMERRIEFDCSFSAGAVNLDPSLGSEPHIFMEKADQMLYSAKESGRGRIRC